jgi:hypothetical protein
MLERSLLNVMFAITPSHEVMTFIGISIVERNIVSVIFTINLLLALALM